jgi:hypothetical protein
MSYGITTGADDDLVYSEASEEQVSASGLSSFRVQKSFNFAGGSDVSGLASKLIQPYRFPTLYI